MSIGLTVQDPFADGDTLTAERLNNLLDDAVPFGMITSDLATGYRLVDIATSQPTATLGHPWLDQNGKLRWGNGTIFQYGSGAIYLTNKSGSDRTLGTVVQIDPTNQDAFVVGGTGGDRRRVAGVLLENIANNASGFVMYRGICYVAVSDVLEPSPPASGARNGYQLRLSTTSGNTGTCQACDPSVLSSTESLAFFGFLLDNPTGTFAAGNYLAKVFK